MNDIFNARVPGPWLFTPGGDEFSWILPTLGLWFASLLERDMQNRQWLNSGRPNSYWMTGFFNPQGFLTGMKQEVTRMHKVCLWAVVQCCGCALPTRLLTPSGACDRLKAGLLMISRTTLKSQTSSAWSRCDPRHGRACTYTACTSMAAAGPRRSSHWSSPSRRSCSRPRRYCT